MKCQNRTDNQRCKANAVRESDYCFAHDPKLADRRLEARKKGGSMSYYQDGLVQAEAIDFTKYKEAVVYLLSDTINRVRRIRPDGSLDIKVANCIGFLVAKLLEAQRQVVLEERFEELEKKLIEHGVLK